MFQYQIIYAFSGLECFFGNLGRCLVTDNGIKCRYNTDRLFYRLCIVLTIDSDAVNTFLAENLHHIFEPGDRLENTLCDNRFHHIQLQLSCFCSKTNGCIISNYFETNLIGYFRNDRIHFSWHD